MNASGFPRIFPIFCKTHGTRWLWLTNSLQLRVLAAKSSCRK
jgi:hypothetical protein